MKTTLTNRLKNDDVSALNECYAQYWKKVYHTAFQMLHSREEAEEVVQDTFLAFWGARYKLKDDRSAVNLLFTIAKRRVIDRFRKNVMEVQVEEIQDHHIVDQQSKELIFTKELSLLTEGAIAKLPPKRKAIIQLRLKNGLTNKEIAKKLGVSTQMVEKQLKLAKAFIRDHLKDYREIASTLILLAGNLLL